MIYCRGSDRDSDKDIGRCGPETRIEGRRKEEGQRQRYSKDTGGVTETRI